VFLKNKAVTTGLEPATSGVTGQHSNQLNYATVFFIFLLNVAPGKGSEKALQI
jgi:hypothetical protein